MDAHTTTTPPAMTTTTNNSNHHFTMTWGEEEEAENRSDLLPTVITTVASGLVVDWGGFFSRINDLLAVAKRVHLARQVLLSFFVPLGLFGNLMIVLIVLHCFKGNRSVMDSYLLALAVADSCVIVFSIVPHWLVSLPGGFPLLAAHDAVCKLFMYVTNAALYCSGWLLVALTSQRTLAVVWPHRVGVLCTAGTTRYVIAAIVVFFSLINLHYLYGVGVVRYRSGPMCDVVRWDYTVFSSEVWSKVELILYSSCPFLCLLVNNSVLVFTLRRSSDVTAAGGRLATQRHVQQPTAATGGRHKAVSSVTVTAMVVSLSYIVLALPVTLFNNLDRFIPALGGGLEAVIISGALQVVFNTMLHLNFCVNFYLYCLTGRRFRTAFLDLFRRRRENTTTTRQSVTTSMCRGK
ncbi:growth hormone secretagogue receptor type 1-like [Babylonia areolata]|uniref:growth hormone secretagogue receptor type 1-like n=1 Tax=Babylonia areolata TaxID=304850 RepID=UPI003FD3B899